MNDLRQAMVTQDVLREVLVDDSLAATTVGDAVLGRWIWRSMSGHPTQKCAMSSMDSGSLNSDWIPQFVTSPVVSAVVPVWLRR